MSKYGRPFPPVCGNFKDYRCRSRYLYMRSMIASEFIAPYPRTMFTNLWLLVELTSKKRWVSALLILVKRILQFGESVQSIGVQAIEKKSFYMKTPFLCHILQATWTVSIEESKIWEISKSTSGPYFERFWLCTLLTQI